jgi:hypothetical protein
LKLNIDSNLSAPDEFYELLIEMHRGLDPEQSRIANAKLILLLANHIGDMTVLREAVALARSAGAER